MSHKIRLSFIIKKVKNGLKNGFLHIRDYPGGKKILLGNLSVINQRLGLVRVLAQL